MVKRGLYLFSFFCGIYVSSLVKNQTRHFGALCVLIPPEQSSRINRPLCFKFRWESAGDVIAPGLVDNTRSLEGMECVQLCCIYACGYST